MYGTEANASILVFEHHPAAFFGTIERTLTGLPHVTSLKDEDPR